MTKLEFLEFVEVERIRNIFAAMKLDENAKAYVDDIAEHADKLVTYVGRRRFNKGYFIGGAVGIFSTAATMGILMLIDNIKARKEQKRMISELEEKQKE